MDRKKKFFYWKLVITVISFVFTVIMISDIDWRNLSNNYVDPARWKEIGYDLGVGVFSAMVLIWFVDEISEHIQDKISISTEKEKIKRANRILSKYIERYELFFYCVVTPIEQREFDNIKMPLEFTFKDMRDLYFSTILISEGIFDSSIECFVKAEKELKDEIELSLRDMEFEHFPEIRESLLKYVEASLRYNEKGAWLSAKTAKADSKTLADTVKEMLENDADEHYREIKAGEKEYPHNLVHTYIALYEMLHAERNAILKYKQELEKI